MSRPRLSVGTFGEILFMTKPSGKVEARARYRDWDGKLREVQATGKTRRAAEAALKEKLAGRALFKPATGDLTPDSTFADLVAYWLEDLDLEARIAPSTRQRDESLMERSVLPAFQHLALRDIGVARCDVFIKELAKRSYNQARQAKSVMRLAFGLAVRHEVIPRNPMDGIARLHKPPHTPDALTPQEVNSIRLAVRFWETGIIPTGPRPDGQLSAIIEVLLGTSARIGEALAIRRRDLDLTGPMPSLAIRGTIITLKGQPPYRQDHPKTAKSRRTVALPSFTVTALQRRLADMPDLSPDALVFASRNGTPLTMANVRRQLRRVLALAGIEGVTPHSFRRTVATTISNKANVELAAELLGHTDT
ncbi:MAG: site-specific integrase, partial [Bifidobacteriaceae bacterium]|nr:site-specific integrase [Bifidobacteriaceae bacterium]